GQADARELAVGGRVQAEHPGAAVLDQAMKSSP
ncbi:MAG: hypothetical protein JWM31_695, partial [Solirubrobacterales bacterium]|nr:hypothetical protein [Solirubrobacterales bacterium]